MGFHLVIKLHTKYETLRDICEWILAILKTSFRGFIGDFESLDVVVIINFCLLQMASSHRTYNAAEAARYILEGDGSELDRTDSDIEIVVNWGMFTNWVQLVSLSEKIPMTADANNNNSREPGNVFA